MGLKRVFPTLTMLVLTMITGPTWADPATDGAAIDRQALVTRHSPRLSRIDPESPFTLGNGRFAFTADVTGLQTLPNLYFARGIPLETKARWAWYSERNDAGYALADANEAYPAYGREVAFPTRMDSAAGQWLRRNPHDLPLARAGLVLDGHAIDPGDLDDIEQQLDLWKGILRSQYSLRDESVNVVTAVHAERDALAIKIRSNLIRGERLGVALVFPRGYDLATKNTPRVVTGPNDEHETHMLENSDNYALLRRRIDDTEHLVALRWQGIATLERTGSHELRLTGHDDTASLEITVEFLQEAPAVHAPLAFDDVIESAATSWPNFWQSAAAIELAGSDDSRAHELERRIVLSRYLLAAQSRARIPTQETGLTSSSWYGKHHTEMSWWHTAHWALWGQPGELIRVLDWYVAQLQGARRLAAERGLDGARWAKMVGPENRESPGGNPLIIWNQPQPIHLADMLYRVHRSDTVVTRFAQLVEDTAAAMASMLTWDTESNRYVLGPPIWIAQEIYEPRVTLNPAFELAYWRYGLQVAQRWRAYRGLPPNPDWQHRIEHLAALPQKDERYVAIESQPDTFDNIASRADHPTMLAPFGLLNDPTVDTAVMNRTLDAVLEHWQWEERIWGWDYPMIAMTAARLGRSEDAIDILLAERTHNRYLPNGHCPQEGSQLPVYLPANAALLAAVAMMAAGWDDAPQGPAPGFPAGWSVRAEGLSPYRLQDSH